MTTANNRPKRFVTTWAEAEDSKKVEIPETAESAKQEHEARASMELGFPEITMKSAMRGGVPPWGTDHNGILHRITSALQWIQSGGTAIFDQVLSDKIGGYPCGAILQDDKSPQILWFSMIDNNGNNPSNTQSPVNGWVKTNFADLEKRLKAAEDKLVDHEGRLNAAEDTLVNHEGRLNTAENNISDIYNNQLPLKAKKDGDCGQDFNAKIMKAGEYHFCSSPESGNGYITQKNHNIDFFSEDAFIFHFDNMKKNRDGIENPDRVLLASCWYDGKQYISNCTLSATNNVFEGGWTTLKTPFTIANQTIIHQNENNSSAWSKNIENNDNFIIDFYRDGFKDKTDPDYVEPERFLTMSASDYSVTAKGAFVSGSNADLAEYYETDCSGYEPGTLMRHGTNTEVTLCKNSDQKDDFFGVVSTRPAYIMNAEIKNNPNSVLIALNGKVPVKVKGVVKCGDKITVGQDGYGIVSINKNDVIVGRAKEDKVTEEVGLVSCYVQARL